ncbi:MAG: thioredoxin family protein [Cyclobacteriaceae bacterium]
MKNIILFVLFTGGLLSIAADWSPHGSGAKEGIEFREGSWEEITKEARGGGKIIFLDIYATWCAPCKALKRNTFSDGQVGGYFNSHFINVTFDGEKGDGRLLARQYRVAVYPTMLFIMPDGSVKKVVVGYRTPKQLLKEAQQVLDAM